MIDAAALFGGGSDGFEIAVEGVILERGITTRGCTVYESTARLDRVLGC